MSNEWQQTFRKRMSQFEHRIEQPKDSVAISIKIRPIGGCFHRDHSPRAYQFIDEYLKNINIDDLSFEEHESGPEMLVYIAAGVSLTTSIINLIVAIIKARSDGIKKGDDKMAPLELIVRRVHKKGEYSEETILRIGHDEPIDKKDITNKLNKSTKLISRKNKETS